MKKFLLSVLVIIFVIQTAYSQGISFSGQLGYANPQGEAFTYDAESNSSKFGLGYSADLLYFLPNFDNKLGVGVAYNGALIFGVGSSDESLSLGLYGMELYGLKGYYNFFKSKVTPYVSLTLGLSGLATPEITSGDQVIVEGNTTYNLGISPEVGLKLGSFTLSAMYLMPMKYETWSAEKQTAGFFQFSLGYRYFISL